METLEELRAIIAGKPEGATHYDEIYYRYSGDEVQSAPSKRFGWEFVSDGSVGLELTRSLSDIERIIDLMERVKSGYEAYTRIEAIKQRYNAENKSKAELLLEAEVLLRNGTQEHCNTLAGKIMEALK